MKYTVKITSAVAIDGVIIKAGDVIELEEKAAVDLLRRGKAEVPAVVEPEVLEVVEDSVDDLAEVETGKQKKDGKK